jgi:hypothetical protein
MPPLAPQNFARRRQHELKPHLPRAWVGIRRPRRDSAEPAGAF